jgi:hypothetical protein
MLLEEGVAPKDIGVIAPYNAQVCNVYLLQSPYSYQIRGNRFSFCILFLPRNASLLHHRLCQLGHRLKFLLSMGFKAEKKRLLAFAEIVCVYVTLDALV